MGRLPPADRMTLAARKNVRDEWENNRHIFQEDFSRMLGTAWTINIDTLQLYAYACAYNDYAKNSVGDIIKRYIEGASYQIDRLVGWRGQLAVEEINAICFDHSLTIDVDTEGSVQYCGCRVSPSGQLVILFAENHLDVNTNDALEPNKLEAALKNAPRLPEKPMNYFARASISTDYQDSIEDVRRRLKDMLQKDMFLEPRFEDAFAKLSAAADSPSDWDKNLGSYVRLYMEALVNTLKNQHFDDDDMMREALVEVVDKAAVAFRIVDEGQLKHQSYNECVVENGILYLQTVPKYFGTNIDDVAAKLLDVL